MYWSVALEEETNQEVSQGTEENRTNNKEKNTNNVQRNNEFDV